MSNVKAALGEVMGIDGAIACALVDANSGMMLGGAGSGFDLEIAAAGNTEVVRAKLKTMQALGLKEKIEDILITLGSQYHIITLLGEKPGLFLYTALDKNKANLAMARRKCSEVVRTVAL
jgi:hypothetical protein